MVAEAVAGPVAQSRRRVLPATYAFWALALMLCFLQFATAAPSPLYGIYQHAWHFSPIMLTAVYASSSLALLVTLLFVGSLSDHVGRRPVLLTAALIELAAMIVFVQASGVAWLFVARVLQGVATGAASGAISAMMIDLQPPGSRLGALMTNVAASGGIALGALGTGLLVQFAPSPTKLVFWILIAVFFALSVIVYVMPETVADDGQWKASLPPKVSVHPDVRGAFLALVPSIVATWALGGLYLSLGPSIVTALSPKTSHLVAALVIVALNGSGVTVAVLGRAWTPERSIYLGSGLLIAGMALAILALNQRQTALFFLATVVAGAGFGPSFSGALRTLTGLAPAQARAEIVTAIYVASYLGLSVPAVIAGVSVAHAGLFPTAYGYGVGVIVLTAAAVLGSLRGRHRTRVQAAATEPLCEHHDLPPCPGTVPPMLKHA